MELTVICEYIELAKKLNFTETARTLNMSQPTLSKHISSLEKTLKLNLFDRSSTDLKLTQAGADLLPYAYRLVETYTELIEKARDIRSKPSAHLSVTGFVVEEMLIDSLSRIMLELHPIYGANFLEIKNRKDYSIEKLIKDGLVDIVFDYGIAQDHEDDSTLSSVLVAKLPWIAVMNKNHRLASKSSLSVEDLKDEVLIELESASLSGGWKAIEKECQAHGFKPNSKKIYSMKVTDLLSTTYKIGEDILILSLSFLERLGSGISPFCTQIPVSEPGVYFPISAYYSSSNDNPILKDVLDILSISASDI